MKKKTIAIIPAKGYSRRVPNKNMKMLGGKPLLYYCLTKVLNNPLVDEVYVSTDDEEIAAYAKSLGANVPFLRDPALSGDAVHGTEPVLEMLRKIYPDADDSFYCLRILAPFPFISHEIITAVIEKSHATSKNVLSLAPLDVNLHHLKTLDANGVMYHAVGTAPINFQIDDAPELYALSGAAQCAPVLELLRHGTYQYEKPLGHPIKKMEGFEVDTLDAFSLAEKLLPIILAESDPSEGI